MDNTVRGLTHVEVTLPVFAVSYGFIPVFVAELYGEILWSAAWCGSSAVGVVEAVRVLA